MRKSLCAKHVRYLIAATCGRLQPGVWGGLTSTFQGLHHKFQPKIVPKQYSSDLKQITDRPRQERENSLCWKLSIFNKPSHKSK
jgi:hypothetical protein